MNKVVVFGGSGFLGSHVADQLTKEGYNVVIFDNKKSKYLRKNQQMIVGNILDFKSVCKAVKDCKYVYHFAAIAGIQEAEKAPIKTLEVNILGTTTILEACKKYKVNRFIFASTIYVYSDHGSFYRCSKQASELIIDNYSKIYNLDYTILRFGSLYGPRANNFNFINNIIKQALLEKKIERKGNGNELREYIHVIDAAISSVNILDKEFKNSNVMITGNKSMRVRDLLNMINEMLGNSITIKYSNQRIEAHYEITPYSFKPKVAKKYTLNSYHDLGQGILECIYNKYEELSKSEKNKVSYKI